MSDPFDPLLDASARDGDSAARGRPTGGPATESAELPGADRPHWVVPALAIGFGSLIAGLVIFGQTDSTETVPTAEGTVVQEVESDAAGDTADPLGGDSVEPDGDGSPVGSGVEDDVDPADPTADVGVVDPIADAAADAADSSPTAQLVDADLPPAGVIRVGESEFPLERSCVGLQPLAPNDTTTVVSAHSFRPDGRGEQVVERWFASDGTDGVRIDGPGAAGLQQIDVGDADPAGAFVASFEQPDGAVVDLAVNPLPEAQQDCGQVVVTNEPGQFAFPYTRAAMAACVADDPALDGRIVAVLTEGGRMIAVANGDDTHTLTLRTAETPSSSALELTDPAGALFVDGDRFGYSGLVSDGDTSLDLTFDVDVSDARACTDDD